jgi:hypothetical protein
MVVKNPHLKKDLFLDVVDKSREVCDQLYIVNHQSDALSDNCFKEAIQIYEDSYSYIEDVNIGTMDEVKGYHYSEIEKLFQNTGTFILMLDWDEVLSPELIREINNIKKSESTHDIYKIPRTTFCLDSVIDAGTYLPILFRISKVRVGAFKKVHDLYRIESDDVVVMKSPLLHYSYANISELFSKHNYYAQAEAQDLYSSTPDISSGLVILRMISEACIFFIYTLLRYNNYTNRVGWLYCLSYFSYKLQKYFFYTELQKIVDVQK